MKKQVIYSISITLLLLIAIVGGTYAFFSTSVNSGNIATDALDFIVLYNGDTDFNGKISISPTKEGGIIRTVNIRVAEGSAHALSNLFITIESITPNLSIEGFKWEVYGYKNNELVYSNNGNFAGYNATEGHNVVPIVEDYRLTEEITYFTVYLWIDANNTGNEVLGGSFNAYISASSEKFTGQL